MQSAVLGLRAKTGRAIAVILSGTAKAPQFVARLEIKLFDPDLPATGQPYHEVMEMPWSEATVAVRKLAEAIECVATAAVRKLMREHGLRVVGIVGAPDRNLEKIGNFHIRAHAAEGVLFRRVLEVAAERNGLPHRTFAEKSLAGEAGDITALLKDLGRKAGPPWRADERAAATAAWMVL